MTTQIARHATPNLNRLVVVTGGAGYIGSELVPALLSEGYEVRVFDNLLFGDGGLKDVLDSVEFVEGDVLDPPPDLLKDAYGVIHLAGISSQAGASYRSPRYTDLMNHTSTEILARQARASGVTRFILASSCSIYCEYANEPQAVPPPRSESDHLQIFAPYALSKRAAEEALFELAGGRLVPIALRKGTVYGYSRKMRWDLVVNAFTKGAFEDRKIVVNAGGSSYRPLLDIADAIRAYLAALSLPVEYVKGGIFNVVTRNVRVGDLAEEFKSVVAKHIGVDVFVEMKQFERSLSYQASRTKFDSVFGLQQSRSFDRAIVGLWTHLSEGGDHVSPRYYNDKWYALLAEAGKLKYPWQAK